MSTEIYALLFKFGFVVVFVSGFLVILNAIISSKEIGGSLGSGLKKVAVGTIGHTILIMTFLLLEKGKEGILTEEQIRAFFILMGFFASVFLIIGYVQIYRIAHKLRLFTL